MKKIILVLTLVLIASCESPEKKAARKSWHGSMRGISQSLSDVLPDLIVGAREMTSTQKAKIRKATADLKDYSKNLTDKKMAVPSKDPSLRYIAADFRAKIKEIDKMSDHGDFRKTQAALRGLSRYCIACHTRTQTGSSFASADFENQVTNLSDLEKAQFFTAVRQFEKALIHYEKALARPKWANKNNSDWNEGVMQMLAITVKVKNNPNLALEMISRLFDTDSYPDGLDKVARIWRTDAKNWNKMGASKAKWEGVSSLLKKAEARERKLPNSGLFLKLRAMAKLNTYLKEGGLESRSEQSVLFYSGMVAKSLESFNLGAFPSSYFRACIDVNPNSSTAKSCKSNL